MRLINPLRASAMLDRRLFDLLKTLAAADLDWLADEVVRGVLTGDVPLENDESVGAARSGVFRENQDGAGFKAFDGRVQEVLPLKGQAQLDWAVKHVSGRLRDALAMLPGSSGSWLTFVEQTAGRLMAPARQRPRNPRRLDKATNG